LYFIAAIIDEIACMCRLEVVPVSSVKYIRFSDIDNVLVLPEGGEPEQRLDDGGAALVVTEEIPAWHKVARSPIASGSAVVKHGYPIGSSTVDISPGAWVHVHNTAEWAGVGWPPGQVRLPGETSKVSQASQKFRGYRRAGGRPGVRNDLWVISSAGYAGEKLEEMLRGYHRQYWMDSVKIVEHPSRSSYLCGGFDSPEAILSGLVLNPNAVGVLLIGSDDEGIEPESVCNLASDGSLRVLSLRNPSFAEIAEYLDRLGVEAARVREEFPISCLCVGIRRASGSPRESLPANRLMGQFADWFVSRGGTILSVESPEALAFPDIASARILKGTALGEFLALSGLQGRLSGENGGIELSSLDVGDGITTVAEKILLASECSGHSPITAVLRCGEEVRDCAGVQITYAPDGDLASGTLLAAGGAQIILSASGGSLSAGDIVPTVEVPTGDTAADLDELAGHVIRIASGEEKTKLEE
jgi:altronate hydrolase